MPQLRACAVRKQAIHGFRLVFSLKTEARDPRLPQKDYLQRPEGKRRQLAYGLTPYGKREGATAPLWRSPQLRPDVPAAPVAHDLSPDPWSGHRPSRTGVWRPRRSPSPPRRTRRIAPSCLRTGGVARTRTRFPLESLREGEPGARNAFGRWSRATRSAAFCRPLFVRSATGRAPVRIGIPEGWTRYPFGR